MTERQYSKIKRLRWVIGKPIPTMKSIDNDKLGVTLRD